MLQRVLYAHVAQCRNCKPCRFDETYEKVRYLAYLERRSIAMEIEHIVLEYIKAHEAQNGEIIIQVPSEEDK